MADDKKYTIDDIPVFAPLREEDLKGVAGSIRDFLSKGRDDVIKAFKNQNTETDLALIQALYDHHIHTIINLLMNKSVADSMAFDIDLITCLKNNVGAYLAQLDVGLQLSLRQEAIMSNADTSEETSH